jgi:hypothetical protein
MKHDDLSCRTEVSRKKLDRLPLIRGALATAAFAAAALAPVGIILRKENGETAYET